MDGEGSQGRLSWHHERVHHEAWAINYALPRLGSGVLHGLHGELNLLQLCLHGLQLGFDGANGWISRGRRRSGGRAGGGGGGHHRGHQLVHIAGQSATVLSFSLLPLVDLLENRAELDFGGWLDLNLHGRLDGRQVGGFCGGVNSGSNVRLLDFEGGEVTELAQLFGPQLISEQT